MSLTFSADSISIAPVSIEDGAVYWFLYPYFTAMHEQTDMMIDLHGTVTIKGQQLEAFAANISAALANASFGSEIRSVVIGYRDGQPVTQSVPRTKLLETIGKLLELAFAANGNDAILTVHGD